MDGYCHICQLDLEDPDSSTAWAFVGGVDTSLAWFQKYGYMALGPDDKIYIGNINGFSYAMSVINYPDEKGLDCGFCPKCLRFPVAPGTIGGGVSAPPNMPNYRLGGTPPCGTVTPDGIAAGGQSTLQALPQPYYW